jgi:RHS repeat-associated protein
MKNINAATSLTRPPFGPITVCLSLLLAPSLGLGAVSPSKSGVSPQAISLPSGAGSIAGLGESFDVQLNSGTLSFSVPIQVPPGVGGLQPNLSLAFNAGIANGPFGPGWALALPAFQRKTDDGQPGFNDLDTFLDASGEDLILMADGTYRREMETDGQFALVERIGTGWRQKSKGGMTMLFGQYPNASDPARVSRVTRNDLGFDETFAWLLDEIADVNGNRVQFYYTAFADSPGNLYLSEVRYSVFGTTFHSVQFDYASRPDREGVATMTGGLADYSAGFARIWGQRCIAARVYAAGQPVRKYTFDYILSTVEDPCPPAAGALVTAVSHLRKVTQWDSTFSQPLPPITFSYSDFVPAGATVTVLSNAPAWGISSGVHNGIDLFDVNSDGLPDLVDGRIGGLWKYVLNQDGTGFRGGEVLMTNSPAQTLSSPSAQVFDINGDGLADFANKGSTSGGQNYTFNLYLGAASWGAEQTFASNPPFDYGDPTVALLDLDFNKAMDFMVFDSSGQRVYLQQNDDWLAIERPWGDPALADLPVDLRLNQPNVRLADMNGDRMLDIVQLTLNPPYLEVSYWPNVGRGRFGARHTMQPTAYARTDLPQLQALDVNGDGLVDLVALLGSGQAEVRLNMGDGSWSAPFTVSSPPYDPVNTGIRTADLNGNGTTDILYYNSGNGQYAYLDFVGTNPAPHQLSVIDSGMGRRTLVHYASTTEYMTQAEAAGHPWSLTLPFGVQVVSGYEAVGGQDLDNVPGPDRLVTRLRYRDPFWDGKLKQFRGFAFVEKLEYGDEYWGLTNGAAPGKLTRTAFHVGAPDGLDNDGDGEVDEIIAGQHEEKALKGMVLWTEITDIGVTGTEVWPYNTNSFLPDGQVYSRTRFDLAVRTLHGTNSALLPLLPVDLSREVRFPFVSAAYIEAIEKSAGPKKMTKTSSVFDAYGNLVRREEWGDMTPGSVFDDERFTLTTYRYDTNQWLLDRPERILITDESNVWVAESRFAYDNLGRLTNQTRYLTPSTFVVTARISYDPYGNVRQRTDARGFSIFNDYDASFHTFPVTETVEIGGGAAPLTASAQYDPRFGAILRATDFNGAQSSVVYDTFGRMVASVAPGDSADLPTRSFKYVVADDLRGWVYEYDSSGILTFTTNHAPGTIASQIHSYQRERFGQTNVIESIIYTDGLGRVISSQLQDEVGFSVLSATRYNSRGAEGAQFLPHPSPGGFLPDTNAPSTDVAYDALGRAVKVTAPPDQHGMRHFSRTEFLPFETISYDFEDTIIGGPHANTPTTSFTDGLGRTVQRIEVNQQGSVTGNFVTTFTYDLQDNLLTVRDAQGNVKTNAYDGLGRKILTHDPDKGLFRYFYDEVGNLVQTLDAKGQRNAFAYDGANRLLTEDHGADGTIEVVYHYDSPSLDYPGLQNAKGRLSYLMDESGASFYGYDARGNLVREVRRVWRQSGRVEDYSFASSYDSANRPFEAVFPDGDRLFYEFNRRGLLTAVPGLVDSIRYNAAGQRTQVQMSNGDVTSFQYDPRQRLRRLITSSATAGTIQDLAYEMDGANNMLSMTDGRALAAADPRNLTQSFVLDDLYRLTRATGTGYGTIDYSYDKLGNMLSQTSPGITDPRINHGLRTYGAGEGAFNRGGRNPGDAPGPHALTGAANGASLIYDNNGNVLSGRGNLYTWDTLDRLRSIASTNGVTHFLYNSAGSRVLKYTDGNPAAEVVYLSASYEIRNGRAVKFIFAGPVRVARVEGPLPVPERVTRHEVLYPGWNLVPLPVQVPSTNPQTVLATIASGYDGVYQLNGSNYLTYIPGQSRNTLSNLTSGLAYWIYANRVCTLTLTGSLYKADQLTLEPDWQPVSFGGDGISLADLSAANPRLASVWKFDNQLKRMLHYHTGAPAALNTAPNIFLGEAAFFQVSGFTTLAVGRAQRQVYFYHEDHLGSGNVVTDLNGNIVEELYYYPFGLLRYRYAATINGYHSEYTFAGKEQDSESGLCYFGARYYDPVLCVFISVDPVAMHRPSVGLVNSQRLNAYDYAGNNPLVLIDPDGRSWFSHAIKSIGNFFRNNFRQVAAIAVAVVITVATEGTALAAYGAFAGGFAGGMISSKGNFRAGLIGGLEGLAFEEVNAQFTAPAGLPPAEAAKWTLLGSKAADATASALAHGLVGGIGSRLENGSFGKGFLFAAVPDASRSIYRNLLAGNSPTWKSEGAPRDFDPSGRPISDVQLGRNCFGEAEPLAHPDSLLRQIFSRDLIRETGPLSRLAQLIPGANSISYLHDRIVGDFYDANVAPFPLHLLPTPFGWNELTMAPAAFLNYSALLADTPGALLSAPNRK